MCRIVSACVVMLLAITAGAASPSITAAVGTGQAGYAGDGGPARLALLDNPFDVIFDAAGNMIISDTNNHCIRRVDAKTGIITTIAGTGKKGSSGDGGPATLATMNEPYGIAIDRDQHLYIVDRLNFKIRKVDAVTKSISTIAGTGKSGPAADGLKAIDAPLIEANGIAIIGETLFIADVKAQKVRTVNLATGILGTLVGTGVKKTTDGPLNAAACNGPRALCASHDGHLYLAEREGNCLRKIDLSKQSITTIAGTGKSGFTGDGGPAQAATFAGPKAVCVDKVGNIYLCDTENEAIRKIDVASGIVTTVAGTGRTKTPGLGDGGDALQATLGRPHGVAIDPADGSILIGDTLSHRIRRVK
jgi:streptogramin lyase